MTVYDNGNENIIDKKLRDIITNTFIQSYLHIVNNNLLDKNIFNQSLINKTIKQVFDNPRKVNMLYKKNN